MKINNIFDLTGRVAIVTGSSRGLGKIAAMALAAQGAKVVISSRNLDACENVAAEINALSGATNGAAMAIACHIARKEELQNMVDATINNWGKVDIVICNAGIHPWMGSIIKWTDESFDRFLHANVRSAVWLAQMTVPKMAERGWGRFVFVSSLGALFGDPVATPYGLTKLAGQRLIQGLAAEFAGQGVSANAIVPGTFATDMTKNMVSDEKWLRRHNERSPSRRVGNPEEFAGIAVMLASDAASYINGQSICIDGGYSIAY